MTVYELVERLYGEIVANQARVRVDGKFAVVGIVGQSGLELTELGAKMAETFAPAVTEASTEEPVKKTRARKTVED